MPLLADIDKTVATLYGVTGMFAIKRSVFVIDAKGILRWSHVSSLGLTYRSTKELLAVLTGLDRATPSLAP